MSQTLTFTQSTPGPPPGLLTLYGNAVHSSTVYSFIETKLFSRLVGDYLAEDEYAALQQALADDPERGAVVRGSGGVRKVRWAQRGRGKRGGVRVIYYVKTHEGVIWMLTIYAKNEEQTIPAHLLRKIKEEVDA